MHGPTGILKIVTSERITYVRLDAVATVEVSPSGHAALFSDSGSILGVITDPEEAAAFIELWEEASWQSAEAAYQNTMESLRVYRA